MKYLGFFRLYAIKLAAYFQSLYKHGKSAVPQAQPYFESVESTAWKYLKPVYEATEDKPQKLLVFADKKVRKHPYGGYLRLVVCILFVLSSVKAENIDFCIVVWNKELWSKHVDLEWQ